MDAAFQAVQEAVNGAALSADERGAALWCLSHLPPLYRGLRETNESRYAEQISHLVQHALKHLTNKGASPDAARVATVFTNQLTAMQERLGIPGPDLQPLPAPKKSRKAS